jgi:uncharacterized membrane protein YjfL (UPF0719 family)
MKTIIIIQTVLAYFVGISSLLIVYKLLNTYLRRQYEIAKNNIAYAIFQVGIILGTSLILSSVIDPGVNAIRFINQQDFNLTTLLLSTAYIILFSAIGIFFSILTIAGSVFTLFQMTKVNEWQEIKNNNISVAIISAALIIGLSFIIGKYVGNLCEIIVPYPEVLNIR